MNRNLFVAVQNFTLFNFIKNYETDNLANDRNGILHRCFVESPSRGAGITGSAVGKTGLEVDLPR
jgi:hypothetical protein